MQSHDRRRVMTLAAASALAPACSSEAQIGPPHIGRTTEESIARKARSEEILRAEGVPILESLPVVDPVSNTRVRPSSEVANRTIALLMVSILGETSDLGLVQPLINEWQADPYFSPAERRFIESSPLTEFDRVQFSWRYECVWLLLWSLGLVQALGRPDRTVDVAAMATLVRELGPERLRSEARLRSTAQIVDVLDLTYRYHWAVVDARVNNRPAPARLDAGVVQERHYALNWVTRYLDQEWDDVRTDT